MLTMPTLLCLFFFLLGLAVMGAVKNCHPQCRCEVESFGLFDSFSLTKVDCSGIGPGNAPVPIPLDTSHLDLSLNSITSISDSMLSGPGYTTLVSLDLSSNLISHVSPKAFSKLRYLETLDLSNNALEDLGDGCFTGLPLVELDLSENRFKEFSLDVFTTRPQDVPIMVDLSRNLLTSVSKKMPGHPLNIKSLMLAGNRLKTVPMLNGIPLQYLNLDGNLISSIEEGAFDSMTELVHLSLSGLTELTLIQPVCELCSSVKASRATKFVAEGSRLQLSCEVLHCGLPGWTGGWVFQELDRAGFTSLTPSKRIEMSNYTSTANGTHLFLRIHNLNQTDAGAYKCLIYWPDSVTSSGHVTYVNVTAGA
ncbi:tsukushin-like isoform X2 [Labeo rohita]|uniref:Tsukushi n=1 Tax=Labeo rohita TaxID=84645 RepID=A0A498LJJ9_LABRO|nr:tsukushin-like isoform X2 [Labeo rohita]